MVGQIHLNTMVNGKPLASSMTRDPFDLGYFPGAVEAMKGRTLDRMGQDIVAVTRMLAAGDPDLEKLDIKYTIEEGELHITSEQSMREDSSSIAMATGGIIRSNPQEHVLRATLAVLKGKGNNNTHAMVASDIVQQWRSQRKASLPASGNIATSAMAGLLSVGSAYLGGVPL